MISTPITRRAALAGVGALLAPAAPAQASDDVFSGLSGTRVRFADVATGRALLMADDDWMHATSEFQRRAVMGSATPVALQAFRRHGVPEDGVDVARVPGSFEIPLVARHLAGSGRYAAVVCIGAVIRGETAHFDFVAGEAAAGITRAALDADVPVIFGVLTVDNREQAFDRLGGKEGHKGEEAAVTAIEMVSLLRDLS